VRTLSDYGKIYKPILLAQSSSGFCGFQLFYFDFGFTFRNNRSFEFSHAGISFFKSDKRIAHFSIGERVYFYSVALKPIEIFSFNKPKMFVKIFAICGVRRASSNRSIENLQANSA